MTKLFVGGLPYSVTNDELKEMFTKFGSVTSAMVITDKFTGQSKGFGFVEIDEDDGAQQAIKELDGTEMNGRRIGVSVARPKEERPRDSFQGSRDNRRPGGFNRNRGNDRRSY